DVVVEREAQAGGALADQLLDDDRVVAEILDPGAAVLLRHREAEHADLPGLLPDVAGHDAVLLPLGVVGGDLAGHELADGLPEEQVFLVEEVSLHDASKGGSMHNRIRFCPLDTGSSQVPKDASVVRVAAPKIYLRLPVCLMGELP